MTEGDDEHKKSSRNFSLLLENFADTKTFKRNSVAIKFLGYESQMLFN